VRLIPLGVAVVAAALYLAGLGEAPFVDPPEGFHTAVAASMETTGDFLTPRLNGVRYFDKPPLLYWSLSAAFAVGGVTPLTARLPSALAAVGCAAVTAWLGCLLGGARVGLLAGLITAANLGVFLFGRLVKPDLPFLFALTLAWLGFALAYLGRGARRGLALFWGGLGLAALAKDLLGAVGPLVAVAVFFWLTRERPLRPWCPWWGLALFAVATLPWYLAVEASNRGFLWYTVVDNHLLNVLRRRVFPDEDVPLNAVEFVAVTAGAFLPWALALPWAVARALRRHRERPAERLDALLALWVLLVVGFFTVAPFKLPHYGLPAFPAMALLVARLWDETVSRAPGAPRPRALLIPVALLFAAAAGATGAAWAGILPVPRGAMLAVDLAARNLAARGGEVAGPTLGALRPVVAWSALILGLGTLGMAVAAWRRSAELGATVALATMLAFLPTAGKGMAEFARGRSVEPVGLALVRRLGPDDLVIHEGPLENSASLLLMVRRPVYVVDGLASNLAFGATFPEARPVFWDTSRLRRAWTSPARSFLVSVVAPDRSAVRSLPPEAVYLLAEGGGRRLYSNRRD
jgi:4-amino-4-deoxy-L-arabinose transferase-like glycosyltransferase